VCADFVEHSPKKDYASNFLIGTSQTRNFHFTINSRPGQFIKDFWMTVSQVFSLAPASRLRRETAGVMFLVMSDKQLVLDSIERLPENASLDAIAERVEFMAAIRKGLDQIERGQTIPHDEVKRQLATWLSK
jgi:hypothetical protein